MKHSTVYKRCLRCLLIFAVTLITGCMSSSGGKKYYQLFLPVQVDHLVGNQETDPRLNKIVMVQPVAINDVYNDYRIVYRTSPYEVSFYSYKFWIKKPDKLVYDSIRDYWTGNHVFKRVISGYSQAEPDWLVKPTVYVIEEVDRPNVWYAHLKMDFEVKEFKSGKTLLIHRFNRREPMTDRKVDKLPAALSKLLKEELDALVEKLSTGRIQSTAENQK